MSFMGAPPSLPGERPPKKQHGHHHHRHLSSSRGGAESHYGPSAGAAAAAAAGGGGSCSSHQHKKYFKALQGVGVHMHGGEGDEDEDEEGREEGREGGGEGLTVYGLSADALRDDVAALAVQEERHMMRWRGQEEDPIVIDRFDGRALLDDRSLFMKRKKRGRAGGREGGGEEEGEGGEEVGKEEVDEEERRCDLDRYRDLRRGGKEGGGEGGRDGHHHHHHHHHEQHEQQQAEEEEDQDDDDESAEEGEPFTPSFPVPPSLPRPCTWKQHRLIGITARRARSEPQLEFLLKVKQGGNKLFKFLNFDHKLHGYYRWMKEEEREEGEDYALDAQGRREREEEGRRREREEEFRRRRAMKLLLGPVCEEQMKEEDEEGREEEVLVPTKEMEAVMEKLVAFVLKNGEEFEKKVREKERENVKIKFLKEEDVYHPFYKRLLRRRRREREGGKEGGREGWRGAGRAG